MKVALLADPLDNQRAGVHVYLRELVHALAEDPGEHEFILLRQRVDPDLPFRQIAVPIRQGVPGYATFRLFFLLPRLLRRLGVEAVFEPAHFGPFNLPAGVRRVTMIHDLTPLLFPELHRWHSQLLQRIFLPGILRRADLVLANSRSTERDLHRVFPVTRTKTATVLLGSNPDFRPDHGHGFRDAYGIAAAYFLYVGTIEPRKNLPHFLAAYTLFRQRQDMLQGAPPVRVQCVLVGAKGWKTGTFEAALDRHPYRSDIVLTGHVSRKHLLQAYTGAVALVYPSRYEGFGFPILEALACGTNVICPDNSSLPEVGGALAYYYPTDATQDLADRMVEVFAGGEEVERRAAGGPAWAARFSWSDYARTFNDRLSALR